MKNGSLPRGKVVGLRQSTKAVTEGRAQVVFVALDAEERMVASIRTLCRECDVEVAPAPSMSILGKACNIQVGASVVTLLKTT